MTKKEEPEMSATAHALGVRGSLERFKKPLENMQKPFDDLCRHVAGFISKGIRNIAAVDDLERRVKELEGRK